MISCRRKLLDRLLAQNIALMKGRVLDIGGVNPNNRGTFLPPKDCIESWEFLNVDPSANPDYCCSAERIPIENGTIDTVILTEVLEYLANPGEVLSEIYRVLRGASHVLVSVPFLHPRHGDCDVDRSRLTPIRIREISEGVGFRVVTIEAMGSVGSVIFDILRVALGYAGSPRRRTLSNWVLARLRPIFMLLDSMTKLQSTYITTGYFVVLKKETSFPDDSS